MKPIAPPADTDERTARAKLADEVVLFPRLVAHVRNSLFRRHLELNVRRATPLLAVVSRKTGIDLSLTAGLIKPPPAWPSAPLPTVHRASMVGIRRSGYSRTSIIRSHRYGGIVACFGGNGEDVIAIRVVSDALELTVIDCELRLQTLHGYGRLSIPQTIPATVATAMKGRAVGQVFCHDWLRDEDWPIVDTVDCHDGSTVVAFRTGLRTWRMPEMHVDGWIARDGETK